MRDTWHYKVLTTSERARWGSLVGATSRRDIFFWPEYIIPFERLLGDAALMFFFGDAADYIIYPVFLRPINDLPFYQAAPVDGKTEFFDIVSPYGYSGPLAHVSDQSCRDHLWAGFLAAFHEFCQANNIVCEFARLNPFLGNHRYLQELTDTVEVSNQITYLDLTQSEEAIWRGFNRGNRSNINKARRSGVEVVRRRDRDALQCFYELYLATMRRNHADRWYDFSLDLFLDHFTLLGDKISLVCAVYQSSIVAAASFLHDGDVVHYFLGGSDSDYLSLRPNNLLMYEAICWAKQEGHKCFNLGGGYRDSLAHFKAAFSKSTVDFFVYRRIHNPLVYDELCQRHAVYQLETGQPDPKMDYFPRYRAG
jgi:serine/alanine adding enzyme